jgi:hypothetical protein
MCKGEVQYDVPRRHDIVYCVSKKHSIKTQSQKNREVVYWANETVTFVIQRKSHYAISKRIIRPIVPHHDGYSALWNTRRMHRRHFSSSRLTRDESCNWLHWTVFLFAVGAALTTLVVLELVMHVLVSNVQKSHSRRPRQPKFCSNHGVIVSRLQRLQAAQGQAKQKTWVLTRLSENP